MFGIGSVFDRGNMLCARAKKIALFDHQRDGNKGYKTIRTISMMLKGVTGITS